MSTSPSKKMPPTKGAKASSAEKGVPQHLEKLSWFMDQALGIPGTKIRFGLDSIIGLVPGIGDFVGLLISGWVVAGSVQAGARRRTVMRMLFNVGRDAILGAIPFIGDLFDISSRANSRNMELLRADLEAQRQAERKATLLDKLKLWGMIGFAVFMLAMMLFGFVTLLQRLFF